MYIPTMFYNLGGCVRALPTGSVIPTGVTLGTVTDGTDSWNYIEVEQGYHTYIDVDGTTEEAKLILIGEGGLSTTGSSSPGGGQYDLGGGAGGDVIIQDVSLQSGQYYMSASANTKGYPEPGGGAAFRTDLPGGVMNTTFITAGGDTPTATSIGGDGGDNTLYIGGAGAMYGGTQTGGGGAGSTMNGTTGMQQPGVANASVGGDGGSGSIVSSPFSNAVGYNIVGSGGPGMGTVAGGSFNLKGNTTGDPNQWGLGGKWFVNGTRDTPNQSRAFLFIPISPECPDEWTLIYSDTNVCTASLSTEFYTAANNGIELGNTLYTDYGLTETTASLFRTSGSNEYFSTNTFGEIITVNEICPTSWILQYSDTDACSSSLSSEFWTSGSSTSNGNTLYTDSTLLLTTASLFNTSGSALYFETDINGLISNSGSHCDGIGNTWRLFTPSGGSCNYTFERIDGTICSGSQGGTFSDVNDFCTNYSNTPTLTGTGTWTNLNTECTTITCSPI